jgi:hypothetical protein
MILILPPQHLHKPGFMPNFSKSDSSKGYSGSFTGGAAFSEARIMAKDLFLEALERNP